MSCTIEIHLDDYSVNVEAVAVPCLNCNGHGKHSRNIGAITCTDDWTAEELDSYSRGRYDITCQSCQGRGFVLVPDPSVATPAEVVAWRDAVKPDVADAFDLHLGQELSLPPRRHRQRYHHSRLP